jgi:hypothetical protein
MSIRRVVELNFKSHLDRAFLGSKYKVLEGVSSEDRPNPCIIVFAGEGVPAFSEQGDSLGNYFVEFSVLVVSSIDVETVDEHNDATEMVINVMKQRETRKVGLVDGLFVYDVVQLSVGEANDPENRKMGSGINYKATVCYGK